jgi:uncharacterized protein (TIGR02246 family)
MANDEHAIRNLVATWIDASRRGDLDAILPLMADDVVFLVHGRPPMRGRDAFAQSFRAAGQQQKIDATSEIEEIAISGDLSYCVSRLQVTITPPGGASNRRSGHVLTVLRRGPRGNWVIARDANLLAPDSAPSTS